MTPKQRPVKLTTTILLPVLCFAVERWVEIRLPAFNESYDRQKRPLRNYFVRQRPHKISLFDFDLRTSGLDLFLNLVRLLLRHAFLDCLGRPFHKRFGFRQA